MRRAYKRLGTLVIFLGQNYLEKLKVLVAESSKEMAKSFIFQYSEIAIFYTLHVRTPINRKKPLTLFV